MVKRVGGQRVRCRLRAHDPGDQAAGGRYRARRPRRFREQAHIVLASENSFFLRFPISEIPFKKKTAVGVRGMKLAEGDLLSDIYWLEGDNSTEVEFHDRVVHINRLRIGTRDGKGTRQK
ncbi:MAG: DNA gyrase C-terminal beta-propeller domain-containing protein [Lachnospiraceae bacterium]